MLEGRIAAELAQLEVGLDEDVLADVFELGGVAGEAGGEAEDAAFVAAGELGEGAFVPFHAGRHELFIRG